MVGSLNRSVVEEDHYCYYSGVTAGQLLLKPNNLSYCLHQQNIRLRRLYLHTYKNRGGINSFLLLYIVAVQVYTLPYTYQPTTTPTDNYKYNGADRGSVAPDLYLFGNRQVICIQALQIVSAGRLTDHT